MVSDRTLGLRLTLEIGFLVFAVVKFAASPVALGAPMTRLALAGTLAVVAFGIVWMLYRPSRPIRRESAVERALPAVLVAIALAGPWFLPAEQDFLVIWLCVILFIPPLIAVEVQNVRSGGAIFRSSPAP